MTEMLICKICGRSSSAWTCDPATCEFQYCGLPHVHSRSFVHREGGVYHSECYEERRDPADRQKRLARAERARLAWEAHVRRPDDRKAH
jgi:hypothetical protein